MIELTATATVLGQRVTLRVTVEQDPNYDGPHGTPEADALSRISGVMTREVQRFAEIAGVDVKDQPVRRAEEARIAKLPKNRPAISVAAGTKDPETAVVTRGTFQVGKRRLSAEKENR